MGACAPPPLPPTLVPIAFKVAVKEKLGRFLKIIKPGLTPSYAGAALERCTGAKCTVNFEDFHSVEIDFLNKWTSFIVNCFVLFCLFRAPKRR